MTGRPTDAELIYVSTVVHENIKNVYVFVREEKKYAGQEFPFLNCHMWLRSTQMWNKILQSVKNAPINQTATQDV